MGLPVLLLRHQIGGWFNDNVEVQAYVAPLAIRVNDEILDERLNILALADSSENGKKLTPKQMAFIEEKAAKYDVFTHHKGHLRYSYMLDELQRKIHVIPPSILITAAALETNWGTSRIVKEGNSLYKILNWYSDEGLKPLGEKEDDTYRIKTYPDILSSMQEFALKLNSELKYANFARITNSKLVARIREETTP